MPMYVIYLLTGWPATSFPGSLFLPPPGARKKRDPENEVGWPVRSVEVWQLWNSNSEILKRPRSTPLSSCVLERPAWIRKRKYFWTLLSSGIKKSGAHIFPRFFILYSYFQFCQFSNRLIQYPHSLVSEENHVCLFVSLLKKKHTQNCCY